MTSTTDQISGWEVLWERVDATGDEFVDTVIQHELRQVGKIAGSTQWDRDTLVYMNADATVKMVATPYWSTETGKTFSLCLMRAV